MEVLPLLKKIWYLSYNSLPGGRSTARGGSAFAEKDMVFKLS